MAIVLNDLVKNSKPLPAGITASQVIENYLIVIGGRKNLAMITDITTSMNMIVQGTSLSSIQFQETPDKMRVDFSMEGISVATQIYDGIKGVITSQVGQVNKVEVVTGDELENLRYKAILNLEMNYEKYGIKSELGGIQDINGKDAYIMVILYPSGNGKRIL